MSPITTHILDTSCGRPAVGVEVKLARWGGKDSWISIGRGVTNDDGRVADLLPEGNLLAGVYKLTFETAVYFSSHQTNSFYPYVSIVFEIQATDEHYHVPLLLNPYGYSTYRGS